MKQLTRLEALYLGFNPLEKPPGCPLNKNGDMTYGNKEEVAAFLACLP